MNYCKFLISFSLLSFICFSIPAKSQSIKFSDFKKISQMSRENFKKYVKTKGFNLKQGETQLTKGVAGSSIYEQMGLVNLEEDGKSITYLCTNDKFAEIILEQMLLDTNWGKTSSGGGSLIYCNVKENACFSITNMGLAYTLTYACCKK